MLVLTCCGARRVNESGDTIQQQRWITLGGESYTSTCFDCFPLSLSFPFLPFLSSPGTARAKKCQKVMHATLQRVRHKDRAVIVSLRAKKDHYEQERIQREQQVVRLRR